MKEKEEGKIGAKKQCIPKTRTIDEVAHREIICLIRIHK
jgi:hypothetical protein